MTQLGVVQEQPSRLQMLEELPCIQHSVIAAHRSLYLLDHCIAACRHESLGGMCLAPPAGC
jgi:hypothetical protein